jgi:hypothetical protein
LQSTHLLLKGRNAKISEQQSVKTVSQVAIVLSELGFNLQLIGSERYVQENLQQLTRFQLSQLKKSFTKNKHPRFKKEFAASRHQPFEKTSDYTKCIQKANNTKMAKLVKLVGMLQQKKEYLFWKNRC